MLSIPFAIQYAEKMRERGNYPGPNPGPKGCIVHFTAGHYEKGLDNAIGCIKGGIKNGYTYLCIANTGDILQAHDVLKYGYHAGESAWKVRLKRLSWGLVGSVSDELIGIEICNAGKLTKTKDGRYKTWFNTYIPESEVRFVTEELYGCPTGYYHKYSPAQEYALIKTIMWLYKSCEDFKLEYVLGHHEVAGIKGIGYWRKNDPGGALSMPMNEFRAYLIENKNMLIQKYQITNTSY